MSITEDHFEIPAEFVDIYAPANPPYDSPPVIQSSLPLGLNEQQDIFNRLPLNPEQRQAFYLALVAESQRVRQEAAANKAALRAAAAS